MLGTGGRVGLKQLSGKNAKPACAQVAKGTWANVASRSREGDASLCWALVRLQQVLCPVLPSSSPNILEARPKNSSQRFGKSSAVSRGVKVCHVPYFVRMFQHWQVKVVIRPPENFVVSALPRVNETTVPKPAEQEL